MKGILIGWSQMDIRPGDYVILENGEESTRYRVDTMVWYPDPQDMFRATVTFAPRPENELMAIGGNKLKKGPLTGIIERALIGYPQRKAE